MDAVGEDKVDLFESPARMIIAGYSGSGKTSLVCKIVKKYINRFGKVIICGALKHPLQDDHEIADKINVYSEIIDPFSELEEEGTQTLFILDDIFIEAVQNKYVVDAFTRGRHSNLSVMLITQNLFFSGKYARNISLNATHYLLLKQRDMNQIECLGRQIYGNHKSKEFVEIYKTALKQRDYGYLLVDLSSKSSVWHQFRTNIVNEGPFELILQWKDVERMKF